MGIKETNQFIQSFTKKYAEADVPLWKKKCVQQHRFAIKVTLVASVIFGLLAVGILPYTLALSGTKAIVISVLSGSVAITSILAFSVFNIGKKCKPVQKKPNEKLQQKQFYNADSYKAGKLYYQKKGNIPILEIVTEDGEEIDYLEAEKRYLETGEAIGYLTGKGLNHLIKECKKLGLPKGEDYIELIESIKCSLPNYIIKEMEGVIKGYRYWLEKNSVKGPTLSFEDLFIYHMLPEFSMNSLGHPVSKSPLGCTVVIDRDKVDGITFGRNMDWDNIFAKYSLVINRKCKNSRDRFSTVEVGFPGLVGTITGMNEHGFCLAMNVCQNNQTKTSPSGIPSMFLNRYVLDTSKSLNDVQNEEDLNKNTLTSFNSYHLSFADQSGAKSIHFHQGEKGKHIVRQYKKTPLIVTNCRYPSSTEDKEVSHMHCSLERRKMIQSLFNTAQKKFKGDQKISHLVKASLALSYVNTDITVHKVVMIPKTKKFQLALGDKYVGASDMVELDTIQLFDKKNKGTKTFQRKSSKSSKSK